MYPIVLSVHNILRWLVVIAALVALVRAYRGWLGKGDYTRADDRAGMVFTGLLDLQALVGLILFFFLAPSTLSLLDGSGSMANAITRYFGAEHTLMMFAALAAAHVGRAMVKKADSEQGKFRRMALWFTVAVVLILVAIPWPFLAVGRPWIRLG